MEHDQNKRPKHGLAVSLDESGNGSYRIILDDIASVKGSGSPNWKSIQLYTISPEYDSVELIETGLSEDQLKELGFSIVVRLLALNGLIK